jgi:SAM-dependent methyltransferase
MATSLTVDLTALKQRQQATWASGDYARIAALIPVVGDLLCDAADLRPGDAVLDIAAGSGNTSISAARLGCRVTGIDYVPALLATARERAAAESLVVEFVTADAEELPFASASFDAVISVFGVMFAPDHERAAGELLRMCRPGGTIALASWTPTGFIGGVLRCVAQHVAPPAGVVPPVAWGTEEHVRGLLGEDAVALTARERTYTFRFASARQFVEFFATNYGPTLKAFEALAPEARPALAADLEALATSYDRLGDGGTIAIPSTYLQVIATRA